MAISAFANASGGRLILDVRDLKTQPPSYRVDRIDSSNLSAEQLQQIIGGNVSPRITTEIKEITVGENLVKSVYVVSIPEGDAGKVYQSIPDKKFYRRYNDECLAMLEPEIRERYMRSAGPLLRVDLSFPSLIIPRVLNPWGKNKALLGPIPMEAYVRNSAQEPAEHAVFRLCMDDRFHSPDLVVDGDIMLSTVASIRTAYSTYGGSKRKMKVYEIHWSTAKNQTPFLYGLPQPLFARPALDLCLPPTHMNPTF